MDNPPTAIFAANDQSAIGVFQAAEELGIRIPSDLSVVGFDNIPEAEYLGLTTVDQLLADMGFVAIEMLIKLINNEPLKEEVHKMQTRLIIRTSCQQINT
jgi:DNA-binding LacI/PurR family transcriptional regulator